MKKPWKFFTQGRMFLRSEHGSALPFIALGIVMLTGATGTAIDMGRVQIVQNRMQTALDAAGLAVGTEVSTTNITTETTKYFYANFPANYLGTTITNLSATPNSDNTLITLSVAGTVSTSFMHIFGINTINVSATSQITRQQSGLELVLVMDNTGSMSQSAGGSVSKIQAAITAANSLLDILYGSGNNTIPNLWVGLVPFSQAVNIGTSHPTWLDSTYDATLNWGPTTWAGCVEARTNGSSLPQYDISDDPPSVQPFRQYYSPCDTNTSYGASAWYGQSPSKTNCLTGGTRAYNTPLSNTSRGPNLYCPQVVQPMVAEKSTIVSALSTMTPNGDTHINLGLAWGWRMLSPRWRGIWGGEMDSNNLPLNYNTPLMNKVVILMTDGDNTLSGTNATGTATSNPGLYTAYGFPDNNWLAVSGSECTSGGNCNNGQNEINNRTTAVCNAMKAQGIIIYTIALGSQVSSTGQSLLQACATSPAYYFLSPTTNTLTGIFQQIGDSLANLRVSQ